MPNFVWIPEEWASWKVRQYGHVDVNEAFNCSKHEKELYKQELPLSGVMFIPYLSDTTVFTTFNGWLEVILIPYHQTARRKRVKVS